METQTPEELVGLLERPPSPLRYQYNSYEPLEVTGMLGSRVAPGSRVLEVGCGTGAMLSVFRDHSRADVIGIEPDPERVSMARERGFEVVHGYFDDITASQLGTFDVIVFADVIEHLVDPAPLLMLARRQLRAGGCVIASVPNVAHWTIRLSLLRGKFDYEPTGLMDATHLRWYTAASLERLFRATGFDTVEFDWTSAHWLPLYLRIPFRSSIREGGRRRLVRRLVQRWPLLFGFQHVVVARTTS